VDGVREEWAAGGEGVVEVIDGTGWHMLGICCMFMHTI